MENNESLPEKGKEIMLNLPMPASIKNTIISILIYAFVYFIISMITALNSNTMPEAREGAYLLFWFAVIFGFIKKSQIAWWGAFLLILGGLRGYASVIFDNFKNGFDFMQMLIVGLYCFLLVVMIMGLAKDSTKMYLGMMCPDCKSISTRGNKVIKKGFVCKECGYLWD